MNPADQSVAEELDALDDTQAEDIEIAEDEDLAFEILASRCPPASI